MTHNLWFWLLTSIGPVLLTFLGFVPVHVDWGIAQVITQYAHPVLVVMFVGVGAFIHLATLYRIVTLMLLIEGVKGLIAGFKILQRLLKYASGIGLLFG